MAYLPNNEEDQQRQQNEQGAAGGMSGQGQGVGLPTSGSAFAAQGGVGSGAATQPGTGGTPQRWVNIQNYLGTNRSNESGARLISDSVNRLGENERSRFQGVSDQFRGQADNFLRDSGLNQSQFQERFNPLAQTETTATTTRRFVQDDPNNIWDQGRWTSQVSQPGNLDSYNQGMGDLRNRLNASFTGPTRFGYAPSADVQEKTAALGDRDRLRQTLDVLYARNQTPLSIGQRGLQRQLDLASDSTEQARSQGVDSLNNLQSELSTQAGNVSKDVSDRIDADRQAKAGIRQQAADNVSALNSRMNNQVSRASQAWQNPRFMEIFPESNPMNFQKRTTTIGENLFKTPVTVTQRLTDLPFENAGFFRGLDEDRRQYNALMDLLGLQGKIGKTDIADQDFEDRLNHYYQITRQGGMQTVGGGGGVTGIYR